MHPSPLNHPSRRTFLMQSTAALGLPLAAPQILAKPVAGANEKLNLAWVGIGFQGRGDLGGCAEGNNVVALCDCDRNNLESEKKNYPNAKLFTDFRKMLREMGDKIDAVGVGTPDHNHFAVADLAAIFNSWMWKRGASNAGFHYLGCAKTFALMGKAFAEANHEMLK